MMSNKAVFSLPIRIYVEDTDAGGIVFYANYLKFMERARTELMRALGFDKPALFDGMQFVVHRGGAQVPQPRGTGRSDCRDRGAQQGQ